MVSGDRGLGIELGGGGDEIDGIGHVYPTPPPEDRLLRKTSEPGDNGGKAWGEGDGQNSELEQKDMVAVDKVRKLSREQMGELLPLDTTSALFALQPSSSPSSPARRARSSTLTNSGTGPTRPSVAGRTVSTPPTSRRAVMTTPARNLDMTSLRKRESDGGDGSDVISANRKTNGSAAATTTTVVHNYGAGDAGCNTPGSSDVDKGKASHREGNQVVSAATTSSALPPLPFHSYLSLALSSPASASFPETPSTNDDASTQKAGPVYGAPPHHPDDSAAIAMERIMNFFLLPPKLEAALLFGVFACLDSWLYIFTILPLRFLKAVGVLMGYWRMRVWNYFNYDGNKLRKKSRKKGEAETPEKRRERKKRKENQVSGLNPNHKADLLRGMILFTSCWFLMRFDASQMYHFIRGQSGIKLYVIYNMLDFADKLCAALGQDIFDVLFSREVLDRRPDGHSKIWRPIAFFVLALAYNIAHSLVLFYQVITLNVAVNSYSNALMTLLLSVQFVEIKSTVFKRFEKENLFQLLCADIVERFQLVLMLVIIATRNLVELGVWSLSPSPTGGVLPKSFTFFPKWTGEIMGPFFIVIGSEMIVDWLKHAYITKFNNARPVLYERFLDVQCKDYCSRAFADQNLTKRIGLPVIPLASLFIRATIQTYHMFLATHVPSPLPSASATTIPLSENLSTSETSAALASIDTILRRARSRSDASASTLLDDFVAAATMAFFLLACFLIFLAVKLLLGIMLLGIARSRYKGLKERERMWANTGAHRSSTFGTTTITEENRAIIYGGNPEEEMRVSEMVRKGREKEMRVEMETLEGVTRYKMCAKRIW